MASDWRIMSIRDVLKKSFVASLSNADLSARAVAIALIVTCVLAVYIFLVYRVVTRKSFYNKSFNISLAAMALITAAIIITIQSSIVVSLGMVGALSIVRFRTAIKDPMDLVFLFWSISVGIICGAQLYIVALIVSVLVTVMILALNALPVTRASKLLLINTDGPESEGQIMEIVHRFSKSANVKSRSLTPDQLDLVIEVNVSQELELLKALQEVKTIRSMSLLQHDGEVTF